MSKAIRPTPDGGMVEVKSKSKHKTFTNGHALLINQTADDLVFVNGDDWWHIEPANCDYWYVHQLHGVSLAREFVRYMRATEDKAALGRVFRGMLEHRGDWRNEAVAECFMDELNDILISAKNVNIYR